MPYPDSKYPPAPQGQAPVGTFAAMEKRHFAGLTERDLRSRQRLMAAAPELLECLRRTVSLLKYASTDGGIRGCNADEWWAMEPRCDAVIAKAEGRGE